MQKSFFDLYLSNLRTSLNYIPMNKQLTESYCSEKWESSVVPELIEYIRIPNKSPAFDPDWLEKWLIWIKWLRSLSSWCENQSILAVCRWK